MHWSCGAERYWRRQPTSLVFTPTLCDSQPQPESLRRVVERKDKRRLHKHQAVFSVALGSRGSVCMQACPPQGINFLTAFLSHLLSTPASLEHHGCVIFQNVSPQLSCRPFLQVKVEADFSVGTWQQTLLERFLRVEEVDHKAAGCEAPL